MYIEYDLLYTLNTRLIAVDRRVSDWAKDMLELPDHLDIECFAVLA